MFNRPLPFVALMLLFGLAVALAPLSPAMASEPVAVGDLPDAIVTSIEDRFEGAEILSAKMEVDEERVKYDVTFEYQGMVYEAEYLEDGTLLDIERK